MRSHATGVSLGVLGLLGIVLAAEPERSVKLPEPGFAAVQYVDNGFVVFRAYVPNPNPKVRWYSREGVLAGKVDSWAPEARVVSIADVAIDHEDLAAAAAKVWKAGGGSDNLVFITDKSGKIQRSFPTGSFFAMRICFGPDRNIWVFGKDEQAEKANRDYEVFETYSRDGKRVGKFVLRSSFKTKAPPAEPAGEAFLRSSNDRIAAYSPPAGQWIELDRQGKVTGRWQAGAGVRIDGLAITSAGNVYATIFKSRGEGGYRSLARLDRATATWQIVSTDSRKVELAGADGNQLVSWDPDTLLTLRWFDEPK